MLSVSLNKTFFPFLPALPKTRSVINAYHGKGMFLFNHTLNTFCLQLYGIGHMVKDNSDSKRGNLHGLLFPIFYMHHPQTK